MSMRSAEVIVIGAGPAGAMAACLLVRAGVDVLLTDRAPFPRPKLCGGCLAHAGYELLEANGLHSIPSVSNASSIDCLKLHSGARSITLPVPPYRVIDRARFDQDLVHAAASAGAQFSPETQARVRPDRGVELMHADGHRETITPRTIIVADGIKGTALRDLDRFAWRTRPNAHVGIGAIASALPRSFDHDAISMHHFSGGYAGVARLSDGRAIIAGAISPSWIKRQHDTTPMNALLRGIGIEFDQRTTFITNPGAPGLTRRRAAIEDDARVFLIGDAAGYIEPFTGEGMTWAITDACLIVEHALAAMSGSYRTGAWTNQHAQLNRRRKLLCHATARLLRSSGLTNAIISAGSRSRALSAGLSRAVDLMQRQNLARTGIA
jgi:flavin-dependent dehydrogenase